MRSRAPGLALLLALPLALSFGTTADAQSAPSSLCCDSGTGVCSRLKGADSGALPTAPNTAPTPDPLGVASQCPLPSPSGKAVTIEIPGAAAQDGAKLLVDTTEPYEGFWGACLAPSITYSPQLPAVCYRVKVSGSITGVTAVSEHLYSVVTAPTTSVFAPYTADSIAAEKTNRDKAIAAANPDSYQVLMTCRLPDPTKKCSGTDGCCADDPDPIHRADSARKGCCNGCCPPYRSVSHSCCDLGAHMTSLDGKYARGFASMPTFQ